MAKRSQRGGCARISVAHYQFQTRYEYERNPTYRLAADGFPYIDERVVLAMTDGSALESAFRSEQLQVHSAWPAETAARLVADLGDQLVVEEYTGINLFIRNMSRNRAAWDDVRVREAFYRWFDPQAFIDLVANGWGVAPVGQLAAGLEKWQLSEEEAGDYKRYDPEAARQLLDAAGFDFSQDYELTTITGEVNETALQVMDQQMRDVGINVTYKVAPASEWLPNITSTGEYDVCLVQHPADDTPATPLRLNHTTSLNINSWMGIRDPAIDAMIEESEQLLDEAENIAKVKEVQIALLEQYAHLSYVYTPLQRELRYAYIKDWETTQATPGHPMYRVEAWMDV